MARRVDTALLGPQKGLRQGGMTSHRTILSILTLLVVASAALPSAAAASSLLGGYGGPGEGNQAILGSALLNGTGGGSGGGSAGSSAASSRSGGATPGGSSGRGNKTSAVGKRPVAGASHGRSGVGGASAGSVDAHSVRSLGQTSPPVHDGSEPLGLSGADLLYILLALGVLASTGALTWRLTRTFPDPNAHNR
jgi:hypothetical protein